MEIHRSLWLLVCLLNAQNTFVVSISYIGLGLTSIPDEIDPSVSNLEFFDNSISIITKSNFNDKYPDLADIVLDKNSITAVERGCFKGTALREISFVQNRLTASCLDNRVTAYKSGIRKFKSPNDAGIQVTLRNSDEFIKRTDQRVTFDVHSTESISGFSYVLLSKGGIVYTDNHASSSPTTKHTIIIPMTPEMAHKLAPSGRLNIWYLTSTGEIVTDSLELKVEGAFLNEVELNFTEAEMRPRQINALNVQANPGSLIGVLAVDKRVLLLKQGNDLGNDEVLSDLKKYDSSPKPGGSPGGSDSSEIFERRNHVACGLGGLGGVPVPVLVRGRSLPSQRSLVPHQKELPNFHVPERFHPINLKGHWLNQSSYAHTSPKVGFGLNCISEASDLFPGNGR
ncbi:hypothetical protein CAPTEDRAFT_217856 [Capitella teleta]|uniref:Alpha-2-macroglobulin bait region domain-containing protein n=1 Tax=Capitella teleta TaxID=283909 RepID=R7VKW2_CAPTE|nr:hypothetical protein CAPTEDRAFT_217856 [Capitella teleta]|eukprot:ELU17716.1 hypothetical protein CAPTEDRAFT_217856 [Capitella teleta]